MNWQEAITAAISLLILSMISERLANFLKLALSGENVPGLLHFLRPRTQGPRVTWGNLGVPEKDPACEKQRELGILRLNLLCGLAVAGSMGVDLMRVFNREVIIGHYVWQAGPDWADVFSAITGTLLASFFLSFGSKFWHDLLDLLLEVKNLRGKLADQTTYQVETVKQLDEHLQLRASDVVDAAFAQQRTQLMELPGVQSVGKGSVAKPDGSQAPGIVVALHPGADAALVPRIYYDQGGGRAVEVPRQIYQASALKIAANFGSKTPIGPGSCICNQATPQAVGQPVFGSVCFPVYAQGSSEPLLLTCYHVVRFGGSDDSKAHSWAELGLDATNRDIVLLTGSGRTLAATLTRGLRNAQLDVALARPAPDCALNAAFPGQTWRVQKARWIGSDDQGVTAVQLVGGASGVKTGLVMEWDVDADIDYAEPRPFRLHNLFTVASRDGRAITTPGDSGSLIMDDAGYALGVVVAGNDERTYAMPFQRILNQLNLSLTHA